MSDDPRNDHAFDDLSTWPLEGLPNTDSGAIEIRRRAIEAAMTFLRTVYPDASDAENLEALDIAVEEAAEAAGIVLRPADES